MNETSIKYLSSQTVQTVTNQTVTASGTESAGSDSDYKVADADEFGLDKVTDDDGSFGVLNSMNDRYEVVLNTSDIEANANNAGHTNGLSTGDSVTLEITSRTGGTTQVILTMPQQLAGKDAGDPVEL